MTSVTFVAVVAIFKRAVIDDAACAEPAKGSKISELHAAMKPAVFSRLTLMPIISTPRMVNAYIALKMIALYACCIYWNGLPVHPLAQALA
jgi:hypothetical protein